VQADQEDGTVEVAFYKLDYKINQMRLFVTYIDSTFAEHEIMNIKKCSIDGFQDWD
jgi:hypothetical protein